MVDFVIIGAPKAGTSSLFYWLESHPSLMGSSPKETFFLMDEGHPLQGRHGACLKEDGIAAYERFFKADDSSRMRFEGTTHYFYQKTARDYLTSQHPQPRIIMLLREPAARIFSAFRFTRDNLSNCDRSLTFNRYVDSLLFGSMDDLRPYYYSDSSFQIACHELAMSQYVDWLEWWLERLAHSNLDLILFESLKEQPKEVMRGVCDSLGIDPSFYNEFDFGLKNKTMPVRFQSAHRLARKWGSGVPDGSLKSWVKDKYLKWQGSGESLDSDYEWGLSVLRDYYAPYNRRLEQQFGVSLSRWWGDDIIASNAGDNDFGHGR